MAKLVNTSVPGYAKDQHTSVVINKNMDQYDMIKGNREKNKELHQIRIELNNLRKEFNKFKQLFFEKN